MRSKESTLSEEAIQELRNYEDYIIPWNAQVKKLTCTGTARDGAVMSDWQHFLQRFREQAQTSSDDRIGWWNTTFANAKQKSAPAQVLPKFGPFLCLRLNPARNTTGVLSAADSIWVNTMRAALDSKLGTELGVYGARDEYRFLLRNMALSEDVDSMVVPFLKLEGPIYVNRYVFP